MSTQRGITAYGLSLPYYRLKRKTILEAMGWFNPGLAALKDGEKTVANHDEDSLTLAVAAGKGCMRSIQGSDVGSLFLASTTLPFIERNNAGIAAAALNLSPRIKVAELGGAVKSGLTALDSAIKEDGDGMSLVCASDCRLGKAGGANESLFGDGAAAFAVGHEGVIAAFLGSFSLSYDFGDFRRVNGDKYVKAWEERWIREQGYTRFIPETIQGMLKKADLRAEDVSTFIFPPLSARDHASLVKAMKLKPDQIQDHCMQRIGNTGTAHPLIMLVAALESAGQGDRILVCSYGGGCDCMLFRVTEAIEDLPARNTFQTSLESCQEMNSYSKYLSFKDNLDKEKGIRGEEIASTSLSLAWREQDAILRLAGGRCRICGTPQFPRERICINPECKVADQMDDYVFSDKMGKLFTYTADHLTYSEDPPSLYGIVDFDGGGRYWFDLTDCSLESLRVGQPVEMSFRRKYVDEARSLSGYFWKAVPFKG